MVVAADSLPAPLKVRLPAYLKTPSVLNCRSGRAAMAAARRPMPPPDRVTMVGHPFGSGMEVVAPAETAARAVAVQAPTPGGGGCWWALGAGPRRRGTPRAAPRGRRAWWRSSLRPGESPRRFPGAGGCSGRHSGDAGAPGRARRRARRDAGTARRQARDDDVEGSSAWHDGNGGHGAERRGRRRRVLARQGVVGRDFGG